jgi:hypothetical protein
MGCTDRNSGERGRGREREPTAGEYAGEGEVRIWPAGLVIRPGRLHARACARRYDRNEARDTGRGTGGGAAGFSGGARRQCH